MLTLCPGVAQGTARGTVEGHRFETRVDSRIAAAYLERGALPEPLRVELEAHRRAGTSPNGTELEAWTRDYSADTAALVWLAATASQPRNQSLRHSFERALKSTAPLTIPDDVVVLVVPGWFYLTHGEETGGDLRRERAIAEAQGLRTQLVAIEENGTVERNGEIVASAIRQAGSRGQRLLVVSASKAAAEVAYALQHALTPEESAPVKVWLSLSGAPLGSPFAEHMLDGPWRWFARRQLAKEGFDLGGAISMRHDRRTESFAAGTLPAHVEVISYVGVPLSGDLSSRARFGYRRMRCEGPSDGLVLLNDAPVPGSRVLIAPGVDHFFDLPDREAHSVALLRVALDEF